VKPDEVTGVQTVLFRSIWNHALLTCLLALNGSECQYYPQLDKNT